MHGYDEYGDIDGTGANGESTLGHVGSVYSIQSNTYPDPEDLPSYPWLGSRAVEERPSIPKPSLTQFDASWASEFSEDDPDGRDDIRQDEYDALVQVQMKNNDPTADPDFQYSDNSPTSDDLLSDADSEQNPSIPKRRGRPPNRAGVRLPSQRQSNARGRGGRRTARGGPGIKRGPRKPLEPNPEFKAVLSQATMAFIAHNHDEAEDLVLEAINQNPEMFTAHSLLSEIHMARGDRDKATAALFNGAHTRPGDVRMWMRVADLLLERDTDDNNSLIPDALYCYSRVLNIQPKNLEVRRRRAKLNFEFGYTGRAANEYEQLLKYLPHDACVMRHLAKAYVKLGEVDRAMRRFEECIAFHRLNEPYNVTSFGWSDLNVYAELYGYDEQYAAGIQKLKSLSRWILGRGDDSIWETFSIDDREWDLENHPRRGLLHFAWLKADDKSLFEYCDLYREVADALRVNESYHEALIYYEPLQHVSGFADGPYFCDLALCYWKTGRRDEADDCYEKAAVGDDSVDLQIHLAEMCKAIGPTDRSQKLIGALNPVKCPHTEQAKSASVSEPSEKDKESILPTPSMLAPRAKGPSMKSSALERQQREQEQGQLELQHREKIGDQFSRIQEYKARAREGDTECRREWMTAAQTLIQDFRSNIIFYPTERYMKFFGYTSEARAVSSANKSAQAAMTGKVQGLGEERDPETMRQFDLISIPQEYRGIKFDTWLEIFLELAVMQAQQGHVVEAYNTITAARDANVFYHSAQSSLLVHVCWFTCALLWNDETTLNNVCRWFMQEYQFTTDAYRLTAAMHRLCTAANTWYNSAPTQKYLLRQLKAMDFPLVGESQKGSFPGGRAGYTMKDESGEPLIASDMDVALLMLYGHILYCGRSFTSALNYFYRAYALDPGNPMVNLSIALSYFHHAFKRQSDSRHHLITQGFAFLSTYYGLRQSSTAVCERQEADYNVARAFHMLGLTHLAIPHYERCLAYSGDSGRHDHAEGFAREAAFALQSLWALGGECGRARQLSETWLVM